MRHILGDVSNSSENQPNNVSFPLTLIVGLCHRRTSPARDQINSITTKEPSLVQKAVEVTDVSVNGE